MTKPGLSLLPLPGLEEELGPDVPDLRLCLLPLPGLDEELGPDVPDL
jgi:hypothetical protein